MINYRKTLSYSVHIDSFACKTYSGWHVLYQWTVCWSVRGEKTCCSNLNLMWVDCFTVRQRKDNLSVCREVIYFMFTSIPSQTAQVFVNIRQLFQRLSRGEESFLTWASSVLWLCFWRYSTCLAVSFFMCVYVCFCLGSQCLALAPGPTHTSAPLPTLWTRCLKSWGGSASYAWEKEMSCVARRSHSEPGPRRFLRLVSWAETLWAQFSSKVFQSGR